LRGCGRRSCAGRTREIASNAGKASWAGLTAEEAASRQAARRQAEEKEVKPRHAVRSRYWAGIDGPFPDGQGKPPNLHAPLSKWNQKGAF